MNILSKNEEITWQKCIFLYTESDNIFFYQIIKRLAINSLVLPSDQISFPTRHGWILLVE